MYSGSYALQPTGQYDRDLTDVYYNTDYVNTVSSYRNRSIMGFEQENCMHNCSNNIVLKMTELLCSLGFLGTLKESQTRKAIWRVIG